MEMIQRSTTTGTVDDIENGKCRNSDCAGRVSSGANKVVIEIKAISFVSSGFLLVVVRKLCRLFLHNIISP